MRRAFGEVESAIGERAELCLVDDFELVR
eukprot:SAG11_NODE_20590_length_442_cov_0.889213_1_plen_28_part_10